MLDVQRKLQTMTTGELVRFANQTHIVFDWVLAMEEISNRGYDPNVDVIQERGNA